MNERLKFIAGIKDAAIEVTRGTGLFASLMIAQACLESNNGQSVLSARYNNFFGIKWVPAWKGVAVELPTKEYVRGQPVMLRQKFRTYATMLDGFKDRVHFFKVNKCYTLAGVFNCSTPEGQARCLLKAGYATDPAYPQKLIAIINECNLKQYDQVN